MFLNRNGVYLARRFRVFRNILHEQEITQNNNNACQGLYPKGG